MQKYICYLFFAGILSCKGFEHENHIYEKNLNRNSLIIKNNFKQVDPLFLNCLPDTNQNFESMDEYFNFCIQKQKLFQQFASRFAHQFPNSDSATLLINNASIELSRRLNILLINQLSTSPLNADNMYNLSIFYGFSDENDIKRRIILYRSYPKKIQESEIGKKTFKKIRSHLFENNIDKDIHNFQNVELISLSGKMKPLSQLFEDRYKYYVLIFGASWCRPCLLDEQQLKKWYPLIDSSLVKIIGLSIDNEKTRWAKYLQKENYPWKNFLLKGSWNNSLIKELNISSIPMSLLTDHSGKILYQSNNIRDVLNYLAK